MRNRNTNVDIYCNYIEIRILKIMIFNSFFQPNSISMHDYGMLAICYANNKRNYFLLTVFN